MVTFKHRRWDCPNCRQFQRHTETLSCPLRVLSRCLISCYVQKQQRSKGEPSMDGVPQLAGISTVLQLLWLWLKKGSWGFFEGPVFSLHPELQVPFGKTISTWCLPTSSWKKPFLLHWRAKHLWVKEPSGRSHWAVEGSKQGILLHTGIVLSINKWPRTLQQGIQRHLPQTSILHFILPSSASSLKSSEPLEKSFLPSQNALFGTILSFGVLESGGWTSDLNSHTPYFKDS